MKKIIKTIGILTVICLMMTTMMACDDGNKETETNETADASETEAMSEETSESYPETKPFFEETKENAEVDVPEKVEVMRPLLLALCKTMTGGTEYDGSNSDFFWNSIYSAINGSTWIHPDISLADNGNGYFVPREVMAEYAEAMFAKNDSLKDIPESIGGIEYDMDEGGYVVYGSDGYIGTMEITEVAETATGYEVTVAFTTKSGKVENHTFVLTSGGRGTFPCSISGIIEK